MRQHKKLVFLLILLVLFAIVAYSNLRQTPVFTGAADEGKFNPLPIEETRLSLDKLKEISKAESQGTGRNIFVYGAPPPPQKTPAEIERERIATQPNLTPPGPPAPQPPPFRFYGYVIEQLTGRRRAFFTNGDDVFITAEGGTLQNRWRLLKILPTSAEFEELSSGRKTSLILEEQPG